MRYFANLKPGKIVLWCFLLWYSTIVALHFDPAPAIWLNALGISVIIGIALFLSVRDPAKPPPDRWTLARLFIMPFCVSSFSQLIKGQGFVLVFPPNLAENAIAIAVCAAFAAAVWTLSKTRLRAR